MNSDVFVDMQCDYDVSESNLMISGIMWFCGVDKRLKAEALAEIAPLIRNEPQMMTKRTFVLTPPMDLVPRKTVPSDCPSCWESSLLQILETGREKGAHSRKGKEFSLREALSTDAPSPSRSHHLLFLWRPAPSIPLQSLCSGSPRINGPPPPPCASSLSHSAVDPPPLSISQLWKWHRPSSLLTSPAERVGHAPWPCSLSCLAAPCLLTPLNMDLILLLHWPELIRRKLLNATASCFSIISKLSEHLMTSWNSLCICIPNISLSWPLLTL